MEPGHNGNLSFVVNVYTPKDPNSKYGTFFIGEGGGKKHQPLAVPLQARFTVCGEN
jgi:hypothetical protein